MDDENAGCSSWRSRSLDWSSSDEDFSPNYERGRVRGRRRGGRSRGGRSRGQRTAARGRPRSPTRHEIVRQRREERVTNLRTQVNNMSEERLRGLLVLVCERDPSIIFEVLDQSSQEERSRGGYHPPPDSNSPDWCVCGRCREMPLEEEKVCCGQTHTNCISRQPDFDLVVLDPLVLLVARRYRQDILAAGDDPDRNRGNRHSAYRQFILWRYGHLGAGNRRVIPSCCVWRIRDQFPDRFGQYRGFVGGRLG